MNDILKENYIAYINSYNNLVSTDSTSNFTVMINLPKNNNFNKVVVLQMSIPKSYYLVQNGYNTFNIYEPDNLSCHLVTIPVGNYTRSLFMAQLNTKMGLAVLVHTVSPFQVLLENLLILFQVPSYNQPLKRPPTFSNNWDLLQIQRTLS